MPRITLLYAGLLGLVAIGIGAAAGRLRGRLGVAVGDGGNPELLLAMRRHANFVEWVPIALLLIALLELDGAGSTAIHGLGATLLAARICHASGFGAGTLVNAGRLAGAVLTMGVMLVASVWAIVAAF
jgi:hypothetical protein